MLKNTDSFFSSALKKINSEAEPVLVSHLQNLDRISNDIKVLEERLRTAAIPFVFIYVFSSEKTRYWRMKYEMVTPDQIHPCGQGLFEGYEEHCLVWGKNADKQYRLSHNVYVSEEEIEKCHHEGKETVEVIDRLKPCLKSSKPLIESKAHIRINIEKILAEFYSALIEALKSKKGASVIIEHYSENFLFWISQLCINSTNSAGKIDETIFINE